MNDWIPAFLCVSLLTALAVVVFLARWLVNTSKRADARADKFCEHLCAYHEDQRLFMRDRMELANKPAPLPDPFAGQQRPKPYQPPNLGPMEGIFTPGGPNDPLAMG